MPKEFHFSWQWDLRSSPEAIWPFAADTNRFNRDTGQPEVEMLSNVKGTKQMRMKLPILRVEWEEEPFRRKLRGMFAGELDWPPALDAGTDPRTRAWRLRDRGPFMNGETVHTDRLR